MEILAIQIPTTYVQRGLRTRVSKKSSLLKSGYFSAIGLFSVKTLAHRHSYAIYTASTGDVLYSGINIDDLK